MLSAIEINPECKNLVTIDQAWHYKIIPSKLINNTIQILTEEGQDTKEFREELEIIIGRKVGIICTNANELKELLSIHYPKAKQSLSGANTATQFRLNVSDERFLESLVREAQDLRSSDIHIETYGEKCRIRMRVDGLLIDRHQVNRSEYPTLINKIKISASCDIAEKRMPQDGRIRMNFGNNKLDIRTSILPTLYGEKIVLRLLGSDAGHINISNLGFSSEELERYNTAIKKPNGIILISGPTGSGKTTTLYATLKQINKPTTNILTIEDPVEYTLDGINQVQLKEDIGLGYAEALKTFLRQDPDVIMLGEIRDAQTAQMAIRAALTGHLVLSTIHTNSAWGTISRLTDMGVPPYLLSSTVNLSVAQRLIRMLCPHCKTMKKLEVTELPGNFRNIPVKEQAIPGKCDHCHYSGYKGRKAIYEVINIDNELSEEIKKNAVSIDSYLQKKKISKLSRNAFDLFVSGQTSLEEIYPYLISEQ